MSKVDSFWHSINPPVALPAAARVDALLSMVTSAPVGERSGIEAQVSAELERLGTPVVDGDCLYFVYRNANCRAVEISGGVDLSLQKVAGTSLFAGAVTVPQLGDATISYTLVVDGRPVRDPWTHCLPMASDSPMVIFRGSRVRVPDEIFPQPGVPAGTVGYRDFHSRWLGSTRRVWTYTPARYHVAQPCALLLAADGHMYFEGSINLPVILDNLIAAGRIPPVIAVGLGSDVATRTQEYVYQASRFMQHQAFVQMEVLPWVRKQYVLDNGFDGAVTLGLSNGGAWALYMSILHDDMFRGAIMQSALTTEMAMPPLSRGKYFYLSAGMLDPQAVRLSEQLEGLLAANGNSVRRVLDVGGHDAALMEAQLADGLEWAWQDYQTKQ